MHHFWLLRTFGWSGLSHDVPKTHVARGFHTLARHCNSPKVANTNKKKQEKKQGRYCSASFQTAWITSSLQLNLLPPTESWMVPHHHLRPWGRESLLQNTSAFQEIHPPTHSSSPFSFSSSSSSSHPTPVLHPQTAPRQVSYLHRAAQAQPIFQEDGGWNVTNPSVLVWICMLIWSNSPFGDSAREQFNHAIYDSCVPGLLCDMGVYACNVWVRLDRLVM